MKKLIHYVGLDVHKESIAPAIAPEGAVEVRSYGNIPGTLDALDKMIKKIEVTPDLEHETKSPDQNRKFPPHLFQR
jgi:hypothetical protein